MVGRWAYDLMYRWKAPWDSVGVRSELKALLDAGTVSAATHPRALDLGCGTGANVVHLAEQGFDAHGVDFSTVALDKARARAAEAAVADRTLFVHGDLTAESVPGLKGTFDLLLDFGTLDDLHGDDRRAMAGLVGRLAHPGSVMLFWCFYSELGDLPWFTFKGASRLAPGLVPGEEQELFGDDFEIEPGPRTGEGPWACFVMTRRGGEG